MPSPRRIALYARSETRYFICALAAELRRRTGATIVLYCANAQKGEFYRSQDRDRVLFSEIVILETALRERLARLPDGIELAGEARRWEALLGTTVNWLAISNRHLGRGYALGGFRHPRSRLSEKSGYDDLLRHYCALLGFWHDEIRTRTFDLILNGSREAAVIAGALGVPVRIMSGSRHGNYHYWAWNQYHESPEFADAYRELANTPFDPVELEAPYAHHLKYRAEFMRGRRALPLIRRSVGEIAKYGYWSVRGYDKAKGYYLRENLKYFYRIWSDSRAVHRLARVRLRDLAGRPFVFYPLHLEPETALQGISPEYFYQLSLVAAVSRDLPAGTVLAVKEHVAAVGRRPADFYRQIAEFKNVAFLDPAEFGLDCVRQAAAIVTICGTAGFEGAILGKPVVAFGRHNIYGFLPHVLTVEDESKLAGYLGAALDESPHRERARRDGARFLAAVKARSFDMGGFGYSTPGNFDEDAVRQAAEALLRSLAKTRVVAAA